MYYVVASRLLRKFDYANIRHIPRLKNQEANDLAQIAYGQKGLKEKLEDSIEVRGRIMETKLSPSDLEMTKLGFSGGEIFEILTIDNLTDTDWRKPIVDYLKKPNSICRAKNQVSCFKLYSYGKQIIQKDT